MSYYSDNNFQISAEPSEQTETLTIRCPENFTDRVKESLDNFAVTEGLVEMQVIIVARAGKQVTLETHLSTNLDHSEPANGIYANSSHATTKYELNEEVEASRLFYRMNEALEVHTHDPDEHEHILDVGNGEGYGHSIAFKIGETENSSFASENTYSEQGNKNDE